MIENAGNLTDKEGNVYQTVRIGNQIWMAENLRVTKYNDGSAIPLDTSAAIWYDDTVPAYCFYNITINSSGFSAMPGGFRDFDGYFNFQNYDSHWWSATDSDAYIAWSSTLYSDIAYRCRNLFKKSCGFSVRLVKD